MPWAPASTTWQDDALGKVTAEGGGKAALVTSRIAELLGARPDGLPVDAPFHTVSAGGNHHAKVCAFLMAYYRTGQAPQIHGPLAR